MGGKNAVSDPRNTVVSEVLRERRSLHHDIFGVQEGACKSKGETHQLVNWSTSLGLTSNIARARHGVLPMKSICGSRTRAGTPCQRKLLLKGGRCPNHGGNSTGPRTPEGKERIIAAQMLRWQKFRAERSDQSNPSSFAILKPPDQR